MWFAAGRHGPHRSRHQSVLRRAEPIGVSSETPAFLATHVECYAGHRGEETPRRFQMGDRKIEITEVLDRWLAPDHRYFKVKDAGGDLYILRHDVVTALWEVAWFRSGAYPLI
jgi:hypothetical protein